MRSRGLQAVQVLRRSSPLHHQIRPHLTCDAFITTALDAGVPPRDVQEAASHADPRTTMRYDRARSRSTGTPPTSSPPTSPAQLADSTRRGSPDKRRPRRTVDTERVVLGKPPRRSDRTCAFSWEAATAWLVRPLPRSRSALTEIVSMSIRRRPLSWGDCRYDDLRMSRAVLGGRPFGDQCSRVGANG